MEMIKEYLVNLIMGQSPLAVTIITAALVVVIAVVEPWLGKTDKVKSGSVVELLGNFLLNLIKIVLETLKLKKK